MADKAKILKNAQKFLAKGQIDKAIAEWEMLVGTSPDSNTFNFLGDLYLKKGDKDKACEAYHRTAQIFRDEGFSLKALAIYKKILNINQTDAQALLALGELNEEKNITTDAIKYYLASADSFAKSKRKDEIPKVYKKILKLAPTNIPMRVKIAELFAKQGFNDKARIEYVGIAGLLEEQNDLDRAKEYLVKSLDIDPNSLDTLLALSRIAEKTNNLEQAANYIQIAIGRVGEKKSLMLRNAEILIAQGDNDGAQAILDKILEENSDDVDAKKLKAELYKKTGDMEMAWQIYAPIADSMIESEQFEEALEILKSFKLLEPVGVGLKLVEVYKKTTETELAFGELTAIAEIYEQQGVRGKALQTYRDALNIQPDNVMVAEKIKGIETELAPPEPEVTEEKASKDAMTEVDVFLRYGLYDEAKNKLESMKVTEPDNIEVHTKLKTVYKETNNIELAVTECIVLAELHDRQGDEDNRKAFLIEAYEMNPDDPRLADKLEGIGVEAAGTPKGAPAEETEEGLGLENFADDISEAEFYLRQGFYSEAADIYSRLLEKFPDNDELQQKLREAREHVSEATTAAESPVGAEATAGAPAEEAAPGETETLSLDELGLGDFEAPADKEESDQGLETEVLEVFQEFKKGLQKQVAAEDAETHYNLGIAYKEMGLVDDAIGAFQMSQRDPNYFPQSASMLGNCYMDKGLYSLAAEAFSAVLMKTDPNDPAFWSIKYDLAHAYEKDGKLTEALGLYTEVYGWDAAYRDVATKVSRLKHSVKPDKTAKPEAEEGKPAAEDKAKKPKSRVSYI